MTEQEEFERGRKDGAARRTERHGYSRAGLNSYLAQVQVYEWVKFGRHWAAYRRGYAEGYFA